MRLYPLTVVPLIQNKCFEKENEVMKIILTASKNGIVQFAKVGTRRHRLIIIGTLPLVDVSNEEEAESLITALCKNDREPSSDVMRLSPFNGELEGETGLWAWAKKFQELRDWRRSGKRGWPMHWKTA